MFTPMKHALAGLTFKLLNIAGRMWWQAVVLSVCFDCPATRLLGVENHVCELQLLPASLMPLLVIVSECQQISVLPSTPLAHMLSIKAKPTKSHDNFVISV